MSAQIEVPEEIVEHVRALCLALPEVTVRIDRSLTESRSTAQSFDIRRRSFCVLVAVLLTDATDWQEIRELVTESYRILAPRKLTARLDQRPHWGFR